MLATINAETDREVLTVILLGGGIAAASIISRWC
jgi:hypothetical protein